MNFDARHVMGYTLYAIAGVCFILRLFLQRYALKYLQTKYPTLTPRSSYLSWRHPRYKEASNDPEYKALDRQLWLVEVVFGVCLVGGAWLTDRGLSL